MSIIYKGLNPKHHYGLCILTINGELITANGKHFQAIQIDEPKIGRWVFDEKGHFFCSECKVKPNSQYATTDYCPNCGAKRKESR